VITEGRDLFYGMPFGKWRDKYQTDASAEKQADFDAAFEKNMRDVDG